MAEHVMNDLAWRPPRFGWPIVLAVAVHAFVLLSPALNLRSSREEPEQPLVQVELIEQPETVPSSPPGPTVPQVVTRSVPVVQPPPPVPAMPASPPETITTVVEEPKRPAPIEQPTRAEAEPLPSADPEPVTVPAFLSVNVASAPLPRPLHAATGGPQRVLRDTAAESGAIRSKARLGDNPRPDYPRSAREAGWEGTVILRVDVLENGMAGAVAVHKTSGQSVLDNAALSAVQKWKFVPAMDGSFPVRSIVYLPVQFDLRSAY